MAEQATHYMGDGYRRIQVKVGLDPREDVERMEAVLDVLPAGTVVYADANAAWTPHDARQFVRATRHLDYVLEQPCADHDANVTVRAACDRPFVLDESIDSLASLLRSHRAGLIDGVTLKIARLGGVTRTRLVRDVAVELGLRVTVEDTGGAQVDTAAIAHLSLSTPASARTHTVDFHNWVTVANGTGDLTCCDGTMSAPTGPGLGITVDLDALGEPLFTVT
jgi:L-alanine-DL-glutamate epimerase-like enolase superfamily enzyme